ncbi:MAG: glycosyltransferase family 4 protein [Merismopedia sp. SIO2A8]|nr:glycosyltransferase family 4 protein [Merismopedia sp. SIO2A8]
MISQSSRTKLMPPAAPKGNTGRNIKVLILNQFFPPDFAATGQLIEELAKQLAQQELKIDVFTGQPGYAFKQNAAPAREYSDGVLIRRSRMSHIWLQRIRGKAASGVIFCLRSFVYLFKTCFLRLRRQYDVVLVTTAPPFMPIVAYLAYRLLGIPYVCVLYDLYPDIATQLGVIPPNHWITRLWHRLNQSIWTSAQQIIVLSDSMKERVIANCPDLPASNISVIHSWADPNHIQPRPKHSNWFAREHELVHRFTVLYSGNMGRCHDIETIVDAMQYLKHEPIQFVFIGGGAKQPMLEKQVATLGLANVRFLPYQSKEDLPFSLTACDLALVSVSEEMGELVAPSKLYSALASGRPIAAICSPNSYLNPLIATAGCGATFANGQGKKLADYIAYLNSDRTMAKRLGAAGRQYMETHFTPTKIATDYAQVLTKAVP